MSDRLRRPAIIAGGNIHRGHNRIFARDSRTEGQVDRSLCDVFAAEAVGMAALDIRKLEDACERALPTLDRGFQFAGARPEETLAVRKHVRRRA